MPKQTTGSHLAGTDSLHWELRMQLRGTLYHFCSVSLLKDPVLRDPSHWRFDLAKSGGGILMDGVTHWIRPLKLWSVVRGSYWCQYGVCTVTFAATGLVRWTRWWGWWDIHTRSVRWSPWLKCCDGSPVERLLPSTAITTLPQCTLCRFSKFLERRYSTYH